MEELAARTRQLVDENDQVGAAAGAAAGAVARLRQARLELPHVFANPFASHPPPLGAHAKGPSPAPLSLADRTHARGVGRVYW